MTKILFILTVLCTVAFGQADCNAQPQMCWDELRQTGPTSTPADHHTATGDVFCAAQNGGASFGYGFASPIGYWDVNGFTGSKVFLAEQNGTTFTYVTLIMGTDYFTSTGTDTDWCCLRYSDIVCITGTASITLPFLANGHKRYRVTMWQPKQPMF